MPMIRSGVRAAICSSGSLSGALITSGFASPRAGVAHGQTAYGWSPYHSVVAIGATPSASRMSCSVKPTTTTRFGSAGTTVSPYLWVTVTGKTGAPGPRRRRTCRSEAEELQAASPATRAADREPVRNQRRLSTTGRDMRAA